MNTPSENSVASRVGIDDIRDAAQGMESVAVRTELRRIDTLSDQAGYPIYLKLESQQPSGAFKLRGAWTAVRRLSEARRQAGVITYSSGNHGQAVAFAAARMNVRAVIVMPETVTAAKKEGVKRWGGEIVVAGTTSEDRLARAREIVAAEGLTVIPPFDHPDVIAGQGTVGLEIVEDLPEVSHVVVPVGGGGLAGGVTTAVKALRPEARVTAVEPRTSAAYAAAVEAGKPVRLDATRSVADGLLPLEVGRLTFEHMYPHARSVLVSDTDIVNATQWLLREADLAVEPSGATTTAALQSGVLDIDGPTVLVVSGGNIDVTTIPTLRAVA